MTDRAAFLALIESLLIADAEYWGEMRSAGPSKDTCDSRDAAYAKLVAAWDSLNGSLDAANIALKSLLSAAKAQERQLADCQAQLKTACALIDKLTDSTVGE